MHKEVKLIIDQWDPFNLYPKNSYGIESLELIKHVRFSNKPISIELINHYLIYIFKEMYDLENRFNKTEEDSLEISKKLIEILNRD